VLGISCHSWEHIRLVPLLIEKLRERGSDIPVIIGGSVITPEDGEKMRQVGVAGVFTSSGDSDGVIECVRMRISPTKYRSSLKLHRTLSASRRKVAQPAAKRDNAFR
jgi:methylmalonyl-CoA mutase cobalamin-binding domain/chain